LQILNKDDLCLTQRVSRGKHIKLVKPVAQEDTDDASCLDYKEAED
jgi:hypothetical protein